MVHKKRDMSDRMMRKIDKEREKRYKILEPYYDQVRELNGRNANTEEYKKLYKEIKENPKFGLSDVDNGNMFSISRLDHDETIEGRLYNDPLQKEAAGLLDDICGTIVEPYFENKIVEPLNIVEKTYVKEQKISKPI